MEFVIVHREYFGYGDWLFGPNDERPDDLPDDIATTVEKIWERGPINAALEKSASVDISRSWLQVPADDLDTDTGELDTGLKVIKAAPSSSSTLGKRARPTIAKTTTRVDEDGFEWSESFDARGQLIDTRVLLSRE